MPDTRVLSQKATDLLKRDHKIVKDLFEEYEEIEDGSLEEKNRLFETIRREIALHSQIEEEIFYPRISQTGDEEAGELVRKAAEEHKIVETLLEELSMMDASDPAFDAKMEVLCESVEHHVDEEENGLFSKVKKMSREDQNTLGRDLAERKAELMGEE